MLKIGDTFSEEFTLTEKQVQEFADVSGDHNPLHLDKAYAANTPFKKPIAHGILSAAIISKILGTQFPGEGTLYLSQTLDFKRPVFPDQAYVVKCEIIELVEGKNIATIATKIFDATTNKIALDGQAKVRNTEKLP